MARPQTPIVPVAVLCIVRDEPSVTYEVLQDRFDARYGERNHKLDAVLTALVDAGMVNWARDKPGDRIFVTESWMTTQNLLDLQLTAEHERGGPVLTVRPFFGVPQGDSQFRSDLFVLMPFDSVMRPIYDDHIARVGAELGLSVKRADDFFGGRNIVEDIWSGICSTKIIIAECTGRNPNVFYELGVAHAIGKPAILVTQSDDDVPFDLRSVRYIRYEYTPRGMKQFEATLKRTLSEVMR